MKHEHVSRRTHRSRSGRTAKPSSAAASSICSGQIALDPQTGELVDGDVGAQTERVIANLGAVLCAAGCTFADVVKTTIFLVDMNDFAGRQRRLREVLRREQAGALDGRGSGAAARRARRNRLHRARVASALLRRDEAGACISRTVSSFAICGDVGIERRLRRLELGERERLLALRSVGAREQIAHAPVVRRRRDAFEQRRLRQRIESVVLVVDAEVDVRFGNVRVDRDRLDVVRYGALPIAVRDRRGSRSSRSLRGARAPAMRAILSSSIASSYLPAWIFATAEVVEARVVRAGRR